MNATLTTANVTTTYLTECLPSGYSIRIRHYASENVTEYMPLHGDVPMANRSYKTESFARNNIARASGTIEQAKIQRAADKKAAAHAKKLASLVILGRATFKATGAQLYAVQSGEKIYHVTRLACRVRSCVDAVTGETCKARYYGSDHCCHGEVVEMLEAQRESELAVAEQVAPLVLGEQFNGDLTAHIEDSLASVPVVVRMEDPLNVYVITPDDKYECVRARDLEYFYPEYREATDEEIMHLNSADGPIRQGRKVERASYRDMYASDYNDVA
jgi:hypothetical protein